MPTTEISDRDAAETLSYIRPPAVLPFDGERFTHAVSGAIEFEHVHRYLFARQFCRGRDVLDVGSGEGYGCALLAQSANSVVGVDLSAEAVAHAADTYGAARLRFLKGDCRSLPVADASVDVVTSFETLEHVIEHERVLAEVARVLRPGGVAIVSTPDRRVYDPGPDGNPFHLRELDETEFRALLRGRFDHVALFAQRALTTSVIVPRDGPAASFATYRYARPSRIDRLPGLAEAPFLVAVASAAPLPPVEAGFFANGARWESTGVAAPSDAGMVRVYDMRRAAPVPSPSTQIRRCGDGFALFARDADPQLFVRPAPPLSSWLLVELDVTLEAECVLQFYTRTLGAARVDAATLVARAVAPGRHRLTLLLARDAPIDLVRFDPGDRPGRVVISGFAVFAPTPVGDGDVAVP